MTRKNDSGHGVLPDANVELFDSHANDYERTVAQSLPGAGGDGRYYADRKTRLLKRHLAETDSCELLDFGCGIGLLTQSLLEHISPAGHITALDISATSVDIARDRIADPRVNVRVMPTTELPSPEGQFTGALAACVFHHIDRAQRGFWMRELFRVARPGGWVAIFEHNPFNPLTRLTVNRCPFDEGVELLKPSETLRLMTDAGFTRLEQSQYLFFPASLDILAPLERLLGWLPLGGQYMTIGRRP